MAKTQAQRKKEYQARMAKNNKGNQSYSSKDQQKSTEPVSVPYNFVSLPYGPDTLSFFELVFLPYYTSLSRILTYR